MRTARPVRPDPEEVWAVFTSLTYGYARVDVVSCDLVVALPLMVIRERDPVIRVEVIVQTVRLARLSCAVEATSIGTATKLRSHRLDDAYRGRIALAAPAQADGVQELDRDHVPPEFPPVGRALLVLVPDPNGEQLASLAHGPLRL